MSMMVKLPVLIFASIMSSQAAQTCLPLNVTNWKVTKESWEKKDNKCDIFKNSAILMENTLFPPQAGSDDERERRNFLKRVILLAVLSPLQYTTQPNSKELKDWPYPLTVAFTNGQRVLFEMDNTKDDKPFPPMALYNYLVTGNESEDPSKKNKIVQKRAAASHGMSYDKKNKWVNEEKLGVSKIAKNLYIGLKGGHGGVNISFGGLGNIDEEGRTITAQGGREGSSNIQHGHVYIQNFAYPTKNPDLEVVMLGIEESAPGKENAHGHTHNALSAFRNTKNDPGLTGSGKMQNILEKDAPNAKGGMRVIFSHKNFEEIKQNIEAIMTKSEDDQREIFRALLQKAPLDGKKQLVNPVA